MRPARCLPPYRLRPNRLACSSSTNADSSGCTYHRIEGILQGCGIEHRVSSANPDRLFSDLGKNTAKGIERLLCQTPCASPSTPEALYDGDPVVSNSRHLEALRQALDALHRALTALDDDRSGRPLKRRHPPGHPPPGRHHRRNHQRRYSQPNILEILASANDGLETAITNYNHLE